MRQFFIINNFLFLFFLLATLSLGAQPPQVFVQLEDGLSQTAFRYHIGDKIEYKSKAYPDKWQRRKIVDLIPKDSIIVLEEGYIKTGEVTKVRMRKGRWGKMIGGSLMSFGAGIVVYGTLGSLGDDSTTSAGKSAGLGALIGGVGWLISKTGRRKKYTMGNHTRLKMYDIRWPDPLPKPKT